MKKKATHVNRYVRKTKKGKKIVKSHSRRKPKTHMRKNYMNRGAYYIEGEPLNPKASDLVLGFNGKTVFETKQEAEKALSKIQKMPIAKQFEEIEIEKLKFGDRIRRLM